MALIYKICPETLWQEAERVGFLVGAPVDLQDGFIHFSTAEQLAGTAEKHFRGQAGLVLIAVDEAALGEGLKYEPSRGGALFPHLYGPMPLRAVRGVQKLEIGPDGEVLLPAVDPAPSPGFDPAAHGWELRQTSGYMALLGPVWVKEEGGRQLFGFATEFRHRNLGGVIHGGMLMSFADQCLGWAASAALGQHGGIATIQLDTHFLSAAREGDFVEAHCEVVRQTRSLVFLSCTLKVGERPVATSNGVWKVLRA